MGREVGPGDRAGGKWAGAREKGAGGAAPRPHESLAGHAGPSGTDAAGPAKQDEPNRKGTRRMKLKLGIVALVATPLLVAGVLSLNLAMGKAEAAQPAKTTAGGVVAKIGDRAITLEELDKKALAANFKIFSDLYATRRDALEGLIGDILMEQQAKAKGITKDELVKQEITAKIQPVTDADVKAWFDQNQQRMGGKTLDQVAAQIKPYLERQREAEARDTYVGTLKKSAAVQVMLEPPRQDVRVAADDPVKGPASAAVTIVEFSDFQ